MERQRLEVGLVLGIGIPGMKKKALEPDFELAPSELDRSPRADWGGNVEAVAAASCSVLALLLAVV